MKLWELLHYKLGAPSGAIAVPRSNNLNSLGLHPDCDEYNIPAEKEVDIESSPSRVGTSGNH